MIKLNLDMPFVVVILSLIHYLIVHRAFLNVFWYRFIWSFLTFLCVCTLTLMILLCFHLLCSLFACIHDTSLFYWLSECCRKLHWDQLVVNHWIYLFHEVSCAVKIFLELFGGVSLIIMALLLLIMWVYFVFLNLCVVDRSLFYSSQKLTQK